MDYKVGKLLNQVKGEQQDKEETIKEVIGTLACHFIKYSGGKTKLTVKFGGTTYKGDADNFWKYRNKIRNYFLVNEGIQVTFDAMSQEIVFKYKKDYRDQAKLYGLKITEDIKQAQHDFGMRMMGGLPLPPTVFSQLPLPLPTKPKDTTP